MEVDSGSAYTVISDSTLHQLDIPRQRLTRSALKLNSYTGDLITVLGTVMVNVELKRKSVHLPLLVVESHGTSLLGRDWFAPLGITVQGIYQLSSDTERSRTHLLIEDFPEVFQGGLGKRESLPVHIEVSPSAVPRFFRTRPVPFALRPKVDAAIDIPVEQGVF